MDTDYQTAGDLPVIPDPDAPPPAPPLSFLDESNPASLAARLHGSGDRFLEAIRRHHAANPELWNMSEIDLYKWLKLHGLAVTAVDNRLRYQLWTALEDANNEDRPMYLREVWRGVMLESTFAAFYQNKPEKVAWLLCPPVSYETFLRETLAFGMQKMREILDLDIQDPATGKINVKLGELQAKITAMVDMRKHGNFTQRMESKSLQVNISDRKVAGLAGQMLEQASMEQLEKQLQELHEKEARILNVPLLKHRKDEAIIVEPEPAAPAPVKRDF